MNCQYFYHLLSLWIWLVWSPCYKENIEKAKAQILKILISKYTFLCTLPIDHMQLPLIHSHDCMQCLIIGVLLFIAYLFFLWLGVWKEVDPFMYNVLYCKIYIYMHVTYLFLLYRLVMYDWTWYISIISGGAFHAIHFICFK